MLDYLDINQVISGIMNMLTRLLGENVKIDFIPGHELASVHADKSQLEQIIMNLCINARDAMPAGGLISIETENTLLNGEYCKIHKWAQPGRFVVLSISDNGSGMDHETCSHLFEPFFTTKEIGKGTGLGLSTVYGIVRQHNGYINAYSEIGKGTTFKIYLPSVMRKASEIGTKIATKIRGGTETILIAEDEEIVLGYVKFLLEKHGYKTICASNGGKAVEEFRKNPERISLVLIDVVMPDMNGKEVYDELKKDFSQVKFLFSSGYTQNAVHKGFVLDENIRLVSKPYDMEELLKAIRKILDGQ
jgi:CheY-like chemotaxis protein